MASKILMVLSAGIVLVLGAIHLAYTFFDAGLLPRDPELQSAMSQAHLTVTGETTVARAWVGFNASHSMALILFGLIFGYLVLCHTKIFFDSIYLRAVGFSVLVGFLVLAKLYWFSVPLVGIAIALLCYVASVMAARA